MEWTHEDAPNIFEGAAKETPVKNYGNSECTTDQRGEDEDAEPVSRARERSDGGHELYIAGTHAFNEEKGEVYEESDAQAESGVFQAGLAVKEDVQGESA